MIHSKCAVMFDPHPDDADFWAGGLSLLLRQIGWDVHYICCGPTTPDTVEQAQKSAQCLGVQRHFLEVALTGNSGVKTELHDKIAPLMQELNPSLMFTTALNDYHHEHCTLSRELIYLFKSAGRFGFSVPEMYTYDSHEGCDPIEIFLDITDVFERHMDSLRCHTYFKKKEFPPEDNTLIRVKRGRSMILGASLPHPTKRALYAEGYHPIFGHPTEVSTLKLLFPDRFYYRPAAWLNSMWHR